MKKHTLGLGAIMMAAAFSLTACGGDDVDSLASEYCDHVDEIKAAGDDPDKLADATDSLTDWLEDNKDAKGDPDDFADAVMKECDIDPNDPSSLLGS